MNEGMTAFTILVKPLSSVTMEVSDIGVGGGELMETELTQAQFNGVNGMIEGQCILLNKEWHRDSGGRVVG